MRISVLWVVCCVQATFKSILELRVEQIDAHWVRERLHTGSLLASRLQLDPWLSMPLNIWISGLVVRAKLLLLVLGEVLGHLLAAMVWSRTKTLD